jgi:hypothetical protein
MTFRRLWTAYAGKWRTAARGLEHGLLVPCEKKGKEDLWGR